MAEFVAPQKIKPVLYGNVLDSPRKSVKRDRDLFQSYQKP